MVWFGFGLLCAVRRVPCCARCVQAKQRLCAIEIPLSLFFSFTLCHYDSAYENSYSFRCAIAIWIVDSLNWFCCARFQTFDHSRLQIHTFIYKCLLDGDRTIVASRREKKDNRATTKKKKIFGSVDASSSFRWMCFDGKRKKEPEKQNEKKISIKWHIQCNSIPYLWWNLDLFAQFIQHRPQYVYMLQPIYFTRLYKQNTKIRNYIAYPLNVYLAKMPLSM